MANWIADAHLKKGAFGAQAKRAGESTAAFAQEKKHASGTTGRRARLAIVLARLGHKRKK